MPDITSALADRLFALSNISLIVGAILALVGTWGTVWSGSIRDRYADDRLHQAEVRVAEANKSAAAANEQAARSQKEAALANLQTARLKKEISWRQMSEQQEEDLASKLKGSQIFVDITWIGSDPESGYFAESIKHALVKAGTNIKRFQPAIFLDVQPASGVSMQGPAGSISALSNAFRQAGVETTSTKVSENAEEVSIVVGSRPPLSPR